MSQPRMTKSNKSRSLQSGAGSHPDLGFQRVKSVYTVREISQLFGLSPRIIRRWTGAGLIRSIAADPAADPLYDFRALTGFRRIREMRASGMTTAQIDVQLAGQLNLFEGGQGQLVEMPSRRSPFEEGLLLHEKGDPRAVQCYRKSILDGEYVADAYCNLANLYFDADDLRLARLHYEIASQIEPCFANVHFNLALVHMREADVAAAISALRKCEEITPEDERPQVEELLSKLEALRAQVH